MYTSISRFLIYTAHKQRTKSTPNSQSKREAEEEERIKLQILLLLLLPHSLVSAKMFIENFKVESPNVKYTDSEIHSVYNYETTELVHENRNGNYQWIVKPKTVRYEFVTNTSVPKLGFVFVIFSFSLILIWFVLFCVIYYVDFIFRVMLVGWGGNNGSTLTGGVIANRE